MPRPKENRAKKLKLFEGSIHHQKEETEELIKLENVGLVPVLQSRGPHFAIGCFLKGQGSFSRASEPGNYKLLKKKPT